MHILARVGWAVSVVSSLFPLLSEAQSPTYAVTDAASWVAAISQANANPGENAVIDIQANLALGGQEFLNANVTILGGGHTIDMQNYDRALFIAGGAVTIQDLRITNGFGAGGTGSNGGGGAGLGGAIFIGSGTYASGDGSPAVLGVSAPNVTLIDVSFSDNAAYGGAGFATTPEGGGGGGMRGSGAWGINSYGLAGGGGGGIGFTAAGGNATANNGGAGGFLLNPGGNPGGDGGNGDGTDGGSGGVNAGGGGGGGYGDSEVEVAGSGGGGGVNGERGYYQNGDAPTGGGDGGFGGGGGGSSYGGGDGGFGGGGGGGASGGNGGFGGGGGASFSGPVGNGGFGAGNGGTDSYGGGGLGAGGAVFVMAGASLTVQSNGSSTFSGNEATGGGSLGPQGSAYGADLFLGADVTIQVAADHTLALASLGGAGNTADPNVADDANDPNAQGGLILTGGGRLNLSGSSYYTGQTLVHSGTLELAAGAIEQGTKNVVIGQNDGDDATLAFQAGSTLTMGSGSTTVILGQGAGAAGTMLIGAGGGAGAFLGITQVTSGSGSGTVIFGQSLSASGTSGNYAFYPVISGNISVMQTGSGTTTLTADHTYTGATTITDGNLVVDGSIELSAFTTVSDHGTLSGSGHVSDLLLSAGGTISPGNSPGTLTSGGQTWEGGASYVWEINSADGGAGQTIGWDLLDIDGALLILSTSEDRFVIDVTSLTLADAPGALSDLTLGESYSWTIATALGGISGFNADNFEIKTDKFSTNPGIHGEFAVNTSGNNLLLTYTAVPEPSAALLLLAAVPALAWLHRARKRSGLSPR